MAIETTRPRSRRAILLGALGGVVASTAAVAGRASPVSATDNDVIHVGGTYAATTRTRLDATGAAAAIYCTSDAGPALYGFSATSYGVQGSNSTAVGGYAGVYGYSPKGTGVAGYSPSGTGVAGTSGSGTAVSGNSTSGVGVDGSSSSNWAVYGHSDSNAGVVGYSGGATSEGVFGWSGGSSSGVYGYSGGAPAAPRARTGVFGVADMAGGVGVVGRSAAGRGGQFSGGLAQIRLAPSSATKPPTSGAKGDMFVDKSGRLWFCKGGTIWVKLA